MNFEFFNSISKALKVLSFASFLKKTVIGMFSLKSFVSFLELITNKPSAPKRKSTKNILNITEKYEEISLLLLYFSNDEAIVHIKLRCKNKKENWFIQNITTKF